MRFCAHRYNVAESCNFALEDWIPWGRLSDLAYRSLARAQVFSHPGFLISLAEDDATVLPTPLSTPLACIPLSTPLIPPLPLSTPLIPPLPLSAPRTRRGGRRQVHTAMWLADDLEQYVRGERRLSAELQAAGVGARRVMEGHARGILSNALTGNFEEDIASFFLGKRVCESRMKKMNLSMADMRRKRDEDAVADECAVCRGSTFLFQVSCAACPRVVGCVEHAAEFCPCALAHKTLETRLSDDGFDRLLAEVRLRAQLPARWLERAAALLGAAAPEHPPKAFTALAAEADCFPHTLRDVFARQAELRARVREARLWSTRAQAMLSVVRPDEAAPEPPRKKGAAARRRVVAAAEVDALAREAAELKVLPEERDAVAGVHATLCDWRARARAELARCGAPGGAALRAALAEGEALRVEGPEHRNVRFALAQQEWVDALPAWGAEVPLAELEARVRGAAHAGARFAGARVEEARALLADAHTLQARLAKALERGTTRAALGALGAEADAWGEGRALRVLLPEAAEVRARAARCDSWVERASAFLTAPAGGAAATATGGAEGAEGAEGAGAERPAFEAADAMLEEYLALGVHLDEGEALGKRVQAGRAWERRARRAAGALLPAPALLAAAGKAEEEEVKVAGALVAGALVAGRGRGEGGRRGGGGRRRGRCGRGGGGRGRCGCRGGGWAGRGRQGRPRWRH